MEFMIILYSDPPYGAVFHASEEELDTTFGDIKKTFYQSVKDCVTPIFAETSYRLFAVDTSNPFVTPPVSEITDMDIELSTVKYRKFDLYISTVPPSFSCPTQIEAKSEIITSEDEQSIDCMLQESFILMESRNYCNAFKVLQETREKFPNDARPVLYIIELLIKMKKYKNALTLAASYTQVYQANLKLQILNAKAHYKSGLYQESLDILRSIQQIAAQSNEKDSTVVAVYIIKNLIELDCIVEANSYLNTLKKGFNPNMKLVKLTTKMQLAQGNFLDATKTIIESLVFNPNYRDLQKFIGRYVIGYKATTIFLNEMFDCFKDANQMFFIGKTFYDYGRCDQAHACLVQAFLMQTTNAAFTLMVVKNCIRKLTRTSSIVSIINTFLLESRPNASFLFGKRCYSVDHIIGKPPEFDFLTEGRKAEPKPPQPLKLLKYEKYESPFTTHKLETIEIIILLQIYLFQNGNLSAAEALIPKSIFQFNLSKTIISDNAKMAINIASFIPTIQRPLRVLKPIYVFGYESIIPISYQTINFRGQEMRLQPVLIQDLTCKRLAKQNNPAYFEFNKRINLIPEYGTVILCFGKDECIKYALKVSRMIGFVSYREAYIDQINNLIKGIKELRAKRKLRIFVHPLMATGQKFAIRMIEFNVILKELIDKASDEIDELQYIDIQDQIVDKENQLKPEFVYNNHIWNSNYLPIMENYINTNMPKIAFADTNAPLEAVEPGFE